MKERRKANKNSYNLYSKELNSLLREIIDSEINMCIEYGGTRADSNYRECLEQLIKKDVVVEDILKYARKEIRLTDLIRIYDCSHLSE